VNHEKTLTFEDKDAHIATQVNKMRVRANHKGVQRIKVGRARGDSSVSNLLIDGQSPSDMEEVMGAAEVYKVFNRRGNVEENERLARRVAGGQPSQLGLAGADPRLRRVLRRRRLQGRPEAPAPLRDLRGRGRDLQGLVHLQCHFEIDTLSRVRRGAQVVGLDFSAPAIEQARRLAAKLGLDADFVQSDVYDAPHSLGGRHFHVVFTGLGALNWPPDIRRWAGVVAALVRPGGILYLSEFLPFSWMFGEDLTVIHDYSHGEVPEVWDEPETYAEIGRASCRERV
jgi:SAM-dependent methyltransferase